MKRFTLAILFTAMGVLAYYAGAAQNPRQPVIPIQENLRPVVAGVENDPSIPFTGPRLVRSEFVSYDLREAAEQQDLSKNPYYVPLKLESITRDGGGSAYAATLDIPYVWLDRQLFLQIEGIPAYYIYIRGKQVGYCEDSRTPAQFDISAYLTDGANELEIVPVGGSGSSLEAAQSQAAPTAKATLFSQPKVRVEDFTVMLQPDSAWHHGVLEITAAVANGYNTTEAVTIGYDIYGPDGKLVYYNHTEITLDGQGRDTVRFTEHIWHANKNFWSASAPGVYSGHITVRRAGKMTEYIPYTVGYGRTSLKDGRILRNNEPINIKAVRYNASEGQQQTRLDIAAMKKAGFNTIFPNYPQPIWFYELCDRAGMYVIDCANTHPSHQTDNPRVGGAVSNDPRWLASFEARVTAIYQRTKNYSCIIARSLGGDAGDGYNMQRCYLLLKKLDPQGIVIYNDAAGSWNSDLPKIGVSEFKH